MKKILNLTICLSLITSPAFAAEYEERGTVKIPPKGTTMDRSEKIVDWKKVKATKGYILSYDLYYQQNCTPTWSKHVKEFKKQNPNIADPNKISVGAKILVQTCESDPTPHVAEHSVQESPAPEVLSAETNEVANLPVKQVGHSSNNSSSQVYEDETVVQKKKTEEEMAEWFYLDAYGGLITEEKQQDTSFVVGVGAHGDILSFVGYDLRVLYSGIVAITEAEARFKTKVAPVRYVLFYGLGNRIGLKNRDLDRLGSGVDSYSYLGLGLEMQPSSKHRLNLDLSHNLASGNTWNLSATAQKLVGEDKWLGVYIEVQSTKSNLDQAVDRKYLTGGLKFSF